MITENLQAIQQRIEKACVRSGRNSQDVQLLLATKTVPPERIRTALLAGYTLIGENKVQELRQKYEALREPSPVQHFIGHLQTNKIKELLKYNIACVQSVDRLDLAEKIHQRLLQENKKLSVLIQVNTSGEASKFGVPPAEAVELIKKIAVFPTLQIDGLMTIGLLTAEQAKVRSCFRLLKALQQQIMELNIPNVIMKELSMGMSVDLEMAIEEGATIVRVGTAIFGERKYPDSYYWNESI